jgi:hypothetical protein
MKTIQDVFVAFNEVNIEIKRSCFISNDMKQMMISYTEALCVALVHKSMMFPIIVNMFKDICPEENEFILQTFYFKLGIEGSDEFIKILKNYVLKN